MLQNTVTFEGEKLSGAIRGGWTDEEPYGYYSFKLDEASLSDTELGIQDLNQIIDDLILIRDKISEMNNLYSKTKSRKSPGYAELMRLMTAGASMVMSAIQAGDAHDFDSTTAHKLIKDIYEVVKETFKEELPNITSLSTNELEILGFHKWYDECECCLNDYLYLIPLWIFDLIPDGTELESISGKKAIKGKDEVDLDTRGGVLAWGIRVK